MMKVAHYWLHGFCNSLKSKYCHDTFSAHRRIFQCVLAREIGSLCIMLIWNVAPHQQLLFECASCPPSRARIKPPRFSAAAECSRVKPDDRDGKSHSSREWHTRHGRKLNKAWGTNDIGARTICALTTPDDRCRLVSDTRAAPLKLAIGIVAHHRLSR